MQTPDATVRASKPRRLALSAALLVSLALLAVPVSGPSPSVAQGTDGAGEAVRVSSGPIGAPVSVTAGVGFDVRVKVPTRGAPNPRRKVQIHHKTSRAKTWTLGAAGRTDRRGTFVLHLVAPSKPTTLTLRLTAPRQGRAKAIKRTTSVFITTAPTPPTATPTATPTVKPTSTPTVTPTSTPTWTPTVTPTSTPTSEPTPTPTETPTVDPTPTGPLGDPNDWTYIVAGEPGRWNPCQTITWSYDPTQQPYPGAEADMVTAFSMIAEKTGFTFARVPVGEAKFATRWSTPAETPALEGSVVGIGGPGMSGIDPDRNNGTRWAITTGRVVLDSTEDLPAGHGHFGWGQVMVHEIGHAVGLGHAAGYVQIMAPSVSTFNTAFGAGDLTGLTQVGASQGCLNYPTLGRAPKSRTIVWAE